MYKGSVSPERAYLATHADGLYVNATGLRTALRRCDLGAELPHLADWHRIGR
jgi:hypothetical protein